MIDKDTGCVAKKKVPVGKNKTKTKIKNNSTDIKKNIIEFLNSIYEVEGDFYKTLNKFNELANDAIDEFNFHGIERIEPIKEKKYLIAEPLGGWGDIKIKDFDELLKFSDIISFG